jgi:hypothetical protein
VTRVLSAALILVCLALTACADRDQRSGESRFGGFYGGVNGGVVP